MLLDACRQALSHGAHALPLQLRRHQRCPLATASHPAVGTARPPAPCPLQRNTEFGYSRKDVILIGAGLIGAGYALYYGLQVGAGLMGAGLMAAAGGRHSGGGGRCALHCGLQVRAGWVLLEHCRLVRAWRGRSGLACQRGTAPSCRRAGSPAAACISPKHPSSLATAPPAPPCPAQATGMDAGLAGNWAQLIIFVGLCFGWVGSYLYRVATKVGGAGGRWRRAGRARTRAPVRAARAEASQACLLAIRPSQGTDPLALFPLSLTLGAANDVREAAGGVRGGGDAQAPGGDAGGGCVARAGLWLGCWRELPAGQAGRQAPMVVPGCERRRRVRVPSSSSSQQLARRPPRHSARTPAALPRPLLPVPPAFPPCLPSEVERMLGEVEAEKERRRARQ